MEALDGNAIAGALYQVFGREMTIAQVRCDRCNALAPLAECEVFLAGPGIVVRCRGCHAMLMVLVEVGAMICIDVGGMSALDFPTPSQ